MNAFEQSIQEQE